jgi:hypothetical protein
MSAEPAFDRNGNSIKSAGTLTPASLPHDNELLLILDPEGVHAQGGESRANVEGVRFRAENPEEGHIM